MKYTKPKEKYGLEKHYEEVDRKMKTKLIFMSPIYDIDPQDYLDPIEEEVTL